MTSRELRDLYIRTGRAIPPELGLSAEHIKNTKRKVLDGIEFRSTLEAKAYQVLKLWESCGIICELVLQPSFVLQQKFIRDGRTIREMKYTADFQFVRDRRTVVVEAKGHRTQPYMMRRKLFLAKYPGLAFEEWNAAKVQEISRI